MIRRLAALERDLSSVSIILSSDFVTQNHNGGKAWKLDLAQTLEGGWKMKRFLTLSFPFPPSARRVPPEAWERLEKTGKPFHRESFYLTGTPFIVSWFLSLPSRETNNERIKFLSAKDSHNARLSEAFIINPIFFEEERYPTSVSSVRRQRSSEKMGL